MVSVHSEVFQRCHNTMCAGSAHACTNHQIAAACRQPVTKFPWLILMEHVQWQHLANVPLQTSFSSRGVRLGHKNVEPGVVLVLKKSVVFDVASPALQAASGSQGQPSKSKSSAHRGLTPRSVTDRGLSWEASSQNSWGDLKLPPFHGGNLLEHETAWL